MHEKHSSNCDNFSKQQLLKQLIIIIFSYSVYVHHICRYIHTTEYFLQQQSSPEQWSSIQYKHNSWIDKFSKQLLSVE
jgi:hypothetical protein